VVGLGTVARTELVPAREVTFTETALPASAESAAPVRPE
jgi:hypothetical protein